MPDEGQMDGGQMEDIQINQYMKANDIKDAPLLCYNVVESKMIQLQN
jgi:hypothetical protein